jgi:hypothetical protein
MVAPLRKITEFGRIDAESERQLSEFFIRTQAYTRIDDQERIVVIGRKGTGKTAIYQTLMGRGDELENLSVTGLRFRDYPWGAHAEVKDNEAAPVERYTTSWRFLILVELAKQVLTNPAHEKVDTIEAIEARRALRRFITGNWGEVGFRFRDIFTRTQYSFDLSPQFAGIGVGGIKAERVRRNQLAGFLVEANRWLEACLALVLDPNRWYFILFDELDTGYDPTDEEYSNRLIGLLLAAREIFQWGASLQVPIGPVVFLRSDIYEDLSFPDKNKITRNLVERLVWTDELSGENSLKSLIDQRIRVITGTDARDPWLTVFDGDLMRGTQPKSKHIAARTYLRPRDMIQFCNLALDEAKRARVDLIRNEDVANARRDYSDYLVDELDDEIHDAHPAWKRYLDVLRRVHKMRFDRADFETAMKSIRLKTNGLDAEAILEVLFRYGIIGFGKIGGGGGGSGVAFSYRDPNINFDPAAPYFRVHPGLKESLELIDVGDEGRS